MMWAEATAQPLFRGLEDQVQAAVKLTRLCQMLRCRQQNRSVPSKATMSFSMARMPGITVSIQSTSRIKSKRKQFHCAFRLARTPRAAARPVAKLAVNR